MKLLLLATTWLPPGGHDDLVRECTGMHGPSPAQTARLGSGETHTTIKLKEKRNTPSRKEQGAVAAARHLFVLAFLKYTMLSFAWVKIKMVGGGSSVGHAGTTRPAWVASIDVSVFLLSPQARCPVPRL